MEAALQAGNSLPNLLLDAYLSVDRDLSFLKVTLCYPTCQSDNYGLTSASFRFGPLKLLWISSLEENERKQTGKLHFAPLNHHLISIYIFKLRFTATHGSTNYQNVLNYSCIGFDH